MNKGGVYLYLRAVSILTLIFFTTTTLAWGMPTLTAEYGARRTEINVTSLAQTIDIPADIGSIQSAYIASPSADLAPRTPYAVPVIVHIQEAHGQAEGQANIERILAYLEKRYGLKTIFLEGAWGRLDPENLHFLNDAKLNRGLLEELDRAGLLGGVELFLAQDEAKGVKSDDELETTTASALRAPSARVGYGVEDPELYRRNLEQFRKVYEAKPATDTYLKELRSKIADEGAKVFNPDLKSFFKEWTFRTEVADQPFAAVDRLLKAAGEHLSLDLSDAREQYDWPQLVRFIKLQDLEKAAGNDARGTENEKAGFLKWLDESGLGQEFNRFFSELFGEDRRSPYSLGPTESIRSRIERFYAAASLKDFKFEDYPNLTRRIGAAILSSELQAPDLSKEAERLNDLILAKLARTVAERSLIDRYKQYQLLKKLFALELTPGEYEELVASKANGGRDNVNEEGGAALSAPSAVQGLYDLAINFYATAQKREQAMFANMLSVMKARRETNVALVTGGFHSAGLSEFFKRNNISCVSVLPRITKLQPQDDYLSLMLGTKESPSSGTGPLPNPGIQAGHEGRVFNLRQPTLIMGRELQKLGDLSGPVLRKFRDVFQSVSARGQKPAELTAFWLATATGVLDPTGTASLDNERSEVRAGKTDDLSALGRLQDYFKTPQKISWVHENRDEKGRSLGAETVEALVQYDEFNNAFDVIPAPSMRQRYGPMLNSLDMPAAQEEIGSMGSFGMIKVVQGSVNGEPAVVFDEIHPSRGFRKLKPAQMLRLFKPWPEVSIAEMVMVLNRAGVRRFYASHPDRIKARYAKLGVRIPEANLATNYVFPFQDKGWDPVEADIAPEGKTFVWHLKEAGIAAIEANGKARALRWDILREKSYERMRTRFARAGFYLTDVRFILPQHIIGLQEMYHWATEHTRAADFRVSSIHVPKEYFAEEKKDHVFTSAEAIAMIFYEICKNTDHIDIDDQAFIGAKLNLEGNMLEIAYYDDGTGNPEAVRHFGKVYTTSGLPNRGYGLRLIKYLTEAFGGRVDFHSNPRYGHYLRLSIPIIRSEMRGEELIRRWKDLWDAELERNRPFWKRSDAFPFVYSAEAPTITYDPDQVPVSDKGFFFQKMISDPPEKNVRTRVRAEQTGYESEKSLAHEVVNRLMDDPHHEGLVLLPNKWPKVRYDTLLVSDPWTPQKHRLDFIRSELEWARDGATVEFHRTKHFVDHYHCHLFPRDTMPISRVLDSFRAEKSGPGLEIGKFGRYPGPDITLASQDPKTLSEGVQLFQDRIEAAGLTYYKVSVASPESGRIFTGFFIFNKYKIPFSFNPSGFVRNASGDLTEARITEELNKGFMSGDARAKLIDDFWRAWSASRAEVREEESQSGKISGEKLSYGLEALPENLRPLVEHLIGIPAWRGSAAFVKNLLLKMVERCGLQGPAGLSKFTDKALLKFPNVGQKTVEALRVAQKAWKQSSKSRAEVRQDTPAASDSKIAPVHIGEKHDEAFTWFKEQIDQGNIPKGLPLVLFDSHSDVYNAGTLNQTNWVFHLLKQGYVSRVLWVLPPWAKTLPGDNRAIYERVANNARALLEKHGIEPSRFEWCFLDEMPKFGEQALVSMDYDFFSRDEDTIYRAEEDEIRDLAGDVLDQLDDQQVHVAAFDLTRSGEPYTYPDQVPMIEEILKTAIHARSEVRGGMGPRVWWDPKDKVYRTSQAGSSERLWNLVRSVVRHQLKTELDAWWSKVRGSARDPLVIAQLLLDGLLRDLLRAGTDRNQILNRWIDRLKKILEGGDHYAFREEAFKFLNWKRSHEPDLEAMRRELSSAINRSGNLLKRRKTARTSRDQMTLEDQMGYEDPAFSFERSVPGTDPRKAAILEDLEKARTALADSDKILSFTGLYARHYVDQRTLSQNHAAAVNKAFRAAFKEFISRTIPETGGDGALLRVWWQKLYSLLAGAKQMEFGKNDGPAVLPAELPPEFLKQIPPEEAAGERAKAFAQMSKFVAGLIAEGDLETAAAYASSVDPYIEEVRSGDAGVTEALGSLEKLSPEQWKTQAEVFGDRYRNEHLPALKKAQQAGDGGQLAGSKAEGITLLKMKLKAQLLLLRARLQDPKHFQNNLPLLFYAVTRTYGMIALEHSRRSESRQVGKAIEQMGIDIKEFEEVIFPFVGRLDVAKRAGDDSSFVGAIAAAFKELKNIYLIDSGYSQEDIQKIRTELGRELDPSVAVHIVPEDYYAARLSRVAGRRVFIDKYPGDVSGSVRKRFAYLKTMIERDTRPGDIVLSRVPANGSLPFGQGEMLRVSLPGYQSFPEFEMRLRTEQDGRLLGDPNAPVQAEALMKLVEAAQPASFEQAEELIAGWYEGSAKFLEGWYRDIRRVDPVILEWLKSCAMGSMGWGVHGAAPALRGLEAFFTDDNSRLIIDEKRSGIAVSVRRAEIRTGPREAPHLVKVLHKEQRIDIGNIKATIRSYKLGTCLANSAMLIYILRALGEEAVLMGIYKDGEDLPIQYFVRTKTWGEIDIEPFDDDSEGSEWEMKAAEEKDLGRSMPGLRSGGFLARADAEIVKGTFFTRAETRADIPLTSSVQEERRALSGDLPPAAESWVKAVVFDIGDVVVKTDFLKVGKAFVQAGVTGLSAEDLTAVLPRLIQNIDFERGKISARKFFRSLKWNLKLRLTFQEFLGIWANMFEPIPESVELLKQLHAAGYKIFFLSDANPIHIRHLKKKYRDVYALADGIYTSYRLKARKAEGTVIFGRMAEDIRKKFGIKLSEMVFLDDRQVNVDNASKAGLEGVLFTRADQARDDLKKILGRRSEVRSTQNGQGPIEWNEKIRDAVLAYFDLSDLQTRQLIAILVQATALSQPTRLVQMQLRPAGYQDPREIVRREMVNFLGNFSSMRQMIAEADPKNRAELEADYGPVADGLEKAVSEARLGIRSDMPLAPVVKEKERRAFKGWLKNVKKMARAVWRALFIPYELVAVYLQIEKMTRHPETPLRQAHMKTLLGMVLLRELRLSGHKVEVLSDTTEKTDKVAGYLDENIANLVFVPDSGEVVPPVRGERKKGRQVLRRNAKAIVFLPDTGEAVLMRSPDKDPENQKVKAFGGMVDAEIGRAAEDPYEATIREELLQELGFTKLFGPKYQLKGKLIPAAGKPGTFNDGRKWEPRRTAFYVYVPSIGEITAIREFQESLDRESSEDHAVLVKRLKAERKEGEGRGEVVQIVTLPVGQLLDPEVLSRQNPSASLEKILEDKGVRQAILDSTSRSEARDSMEYFMAQAKELQTVLNPVGEAEALAMIDTYLKTYSYQSRAIVSSLKSLLSYGLPAPIATFFADRGIFDKTDQSNILSVLQVLYLAKPETKASNVLMPKIPAAAVVAKDKRLGVVADPRRMKMTPEEQRLVARQMIALAEESFPSFKPGAATEEQCIARLSNGHILLLVSSERKLTGVVWAVTNETSSFSELKNLFTKQDGVRGRGTWLLELYLRDLQKKGVWYVVWESRTDKARDFYLDFLDARKGGDLVVDYTQRNGSFSITLNTGDRSRAEARSEDLRGLLGVEERSLWRSENVYPYSPEDMKLVIEFSKEVSTKLQEQFTVARSRGLEEFRALQVGPSSGIASLAALKQLIGLKGFKKTVFDLVDINPQAIVNTRRNMDIFFAQAQREGLVTSWNYEGRLQGRSRSAEFTFTVDQKKGDPLRGSVRLFVKDFTRFEAAKGKIYDFEFFDAPLPVENFGRRDAEDVATAIPGYVYRKIAQRMAVLLNARGVAVLGGTKDKEWIDDEILLNQALATGLVTGALELTSPVAKSDGEDSDRVIFTIRRIDPLLITGVEKRKPSGVKRSELRLSGEPAAALLSAPSGESLATEAPVPNASVRFRGDRDDHTRPVQPADPRQRVSSLKSPASEGFQISDAGKQVAVRATEGVFRVSDVMSMGREVLNKLLADWMPFAYAKQPEKNYKPLVEKVVAEAGTPVVVVFDKAPDLASPVLQAMAQFSARNRFVPFLFVLHGADPSGVMKFKKDFEAAVLRKAGRSVAIRVADNAVRIPELIAGSAPDKALIYDMRADGSVALARLEPGLRERKVFERTMRVYDPAEGSQKPADFFATLREFFGKKEIKTQVQSALEIFSNDLEMQIAARQILEKAA